MIDINKIFSRFLVALFVLLAFNSSAQSIDISKLNHRQLKKFGQNAIQLGDIYTATKYYERYIELKPEKFDALFQLAELYRFSRDYKRAESMYIRSYNGDPNGNAVALFYYAQMLKANGECEKAKEYFLKFSVSKGSKGIKNEKEYKKLGKLEILGCEALPELIKNPSKIVVEHLDTSINKAHIELSPYLLDDKTLIYSSLKVDSIELYKVDEQDKMPVRKFYVAKRVNGKWKGSKELEGPFNKEGVNTGNGTYSPDGKRFYFTRCEKNKLTNKMVCRIFVSHLENGAWKEPEDLGDLVNSKDYTSTMPTVGIDSKKNLEVVYFISDRDGGKGGMDLWYTQMDPKTNSFKEAKNAGKINTPGDEVTPYYDNDNRTLYFSSSGHPGMGGLDVFHAAGELKAWGTPENVGAPINSGADDLYYSAGKGKENGFFVSNRKGGVALKNETCCDDIYEFKYLQYIHLAISGNVFELKDTANIKFLDDTKEMNKLGEAEKVDTTGKPLEKMIVSLYLIDKENEEVFLRNDTTDKNGKYFFKLEQGKNYRVVSNSDDYFRKKIDLSTKNLSRSDTLKRHMMVRAIPQEAIVIKNIYYDFDKADLKKEAKVTIDTTLLTLLSENPKIIVEISSHTDSKGAEDYNKKLSQKRAESVVKYLIDQGIAKDRLVPKGYGKEKPIAPNSNPDGSDNPDGRAMNRRTEFKIIGFLKNIEINYEE